MSKSGFAMFCADGFHRHCYPIIAGFMVDYEEQALITGIKNSRHCSVCLVPPEERGDLTKQWSFRTHRQTQTQIGDQQKRSGKALAGEMDVHMVDNFAWKHPHVNIHSAMMVDILHQLLKGIVMRLLDWTQDVLKDVLTPESTMAGHKRKKGGKLVKDSSHIIQLDDRFRQVPAFHNMKQFSNFSSVSQWTGNEQKAMIQQLVPVLAPLLTSQAPAAMLCIRAIMDFVVLAMYASHDDNTLRYMSAALDRVNLLKSVFEKSRPVSKDTGEHHFNFPKWHAMTHYVPFIRLYGSAQGFDLCYPERAYKFLVKVFLL